MTKKASLISNALYNVCQPVEIEVLNDDDDNDMMMNL